MRECPVESRRRVTPVREALHGPKWRRYVIVRSSAQWTSSLPVVILEGLFRNNWMHMNVTWKSNWIEWIFVTPRFHHSHHSADSVHFDSNYGSLFSIWDRMFRTQFRPNTTQPSAFGAPTKTNPVRLFLGV